MRANEKTQEQLFKDFVEFSAQQIVTGDIDPAYPVIKNYLKFINSGYTSSVDFLLVYVAFYNLKTADEFFNGQIKDVSKVKTGIERRGFRGNKLVLEHLESFDRTNIFRVVKDGTWSEIQEEYEKGFYTGSWSSYKFADLCKNVLERDIDAPDLGLGGKGKFAGPIPGLSLLTGKHWNQCATDMVLQKRFYNKCLLSTPGVKFRGLEELETCLCDFNSMYKGHYYSGNDIDKQMEDLEGASDALWEARRRSFKIHLLGEVKGWKGVRKELKSRYRDEGVL